MKNLGMIEIVPHQKIGSQLLRGRMNKVLNNFWCNFWIPLPKKYKGANFHENWPYRTQVMTISLDMDNSKWWISEEKTLKLPKFKISISQEPFRFRWKNFAHIFFILVGTFEQNLMEILEYGWNSCPSLTWNHPLTFLFSCLKN